MKKDKEYGSNANLVTNMGKNEDRELEPEDKGDEEININKTTAHK